MRAVTNAYIVTALVGLGLTAALNGDIIAPVREKHKGMAYGIEDCPSSVCKGGNTDLCGETIFLRGPAYRAVYTKDEGARWSDCEALIKDLRAPPAKRLFLDGNKHDASGPKYHRIASRGQCAIDFRAGKDTPGHSFLSMGAADVEDILRDANIRDGGKEEKNRDKLYSEGITTCGLPRLTGSYRILHCHRSSRPRQNRHVFVNGRV
ncbi:hypothetical protein PG990_001731 [Apiospora arundinis]